MCRRAATPGEHVAGCFVPLLSDLLFVHTRERKKRGCQEARPAWGREDRQRTGRTANGRSFSIRPPLPSAHCPPHALLCSRCSTVLLACALLRYILRTPYSRSKVRGGEGGGKADRGCNGPPSRRLEIWLAGPRFLRHIHCVCTANGRGKCTAQHSISHRRDARITVHFCILLHATDRGAALPCCLLPSVGTERERERAACAWVHGDSVAVPTPVLLLHPRSRCPCVDVRLSGWPTHRCVFVCCTAQSRGGAPPISTRVDRAASAPCGRSPPPPVGDQPRAAASVLRETDLSTHDRGAGCLWARASLCIFCARPPAYTL